jgi:hypothetical protein
MHTYIDTYIHAYIHTYHHHRGIIPPIPWGGTRDTGPYIHILFFFVHRYMCIYLYMCVYVYIYIFVYVCVRVRVSLSRLFLHAACSQGWLSLPVDAKGVVWSYNVARGMATTQTHTRLRKVTRQILRNFPSGSCVLKIEAFTLEFPKLCNLGPVGGTLGSTAVHKFEIHFCSAMSNGKRA